MDVLSLRFSIIVIISVLLNFQHLCNAKVSNFTEEEAIKAIQNSKQLFSGLKLESFETFQRKIDRANGETTFTSELKSDFMVKRASTTKNDFIILDREESKPKTMHPNAYIVFLAVPSSTRIFTGHVATVRSFGETLIVEWTSFRSTPFKYFGSFASLFISQAENEHAVPSGRAVESAPDSIKNSCTKTGNFPMEGQCTKYYACMKISGGVIKANYVYGCRPGYYFDRNKQFCSVGVCPPPPPPAPPTPPTEAPTTVAPTTIINNQNIVNNNVNVYAPTIINNVVNNNMDFGALFNTLTPEQLRIVAMTAQKYPQSNQLLQETGNNMPPEGYPSQMDNNQMGNGYPQMGQDPQMGNGYPEMGQDPQMGRSVSQTSESSRAAGPEEKLNSTVKEYLEKLPFIGLNTCPVLQSPTIELLKVSEDALVDYLLVLLRAQCVTMSHLQTIKLFAAGFVKQGKNEMELNSTQPLFHQDIMEEMDWWDYASSIYLVSFVNSIIEQGKKNNSYSSPSGASISTTMDVITSLELHLIKTFSSTGKHHVIKLRHILYNILRVKFWYSWKEEKERAQEDCTNEKCKTLKETRVNDRIQLLVLKRLLSDEELSSVDPSDVRSSFKTLYKKHAPELKETATNSTIPF